MALTEEGATLTLAHHTAQVALRARVLQTLLTIWPSFDPRDIDASWSRPMPVNCITSGAIRDASAGLAGSYFQAFRSVEGANGPAPIILLPKDWQRAAAVNFRVTGPVAAKHLVTLNRPDVAAQTFVRLSGAVERNVLDGGREYLFEAVEQDRKRNPNVGWARVTSRQPCYFCAMLASRGPVYRAESSAAFRAHDHCHCMVEPSYGRGDWPGNGREYQTLWNASTKGTKGKDSVTAFRRAYEGRDTG